MPWRQALDLTAFDPETIQFLGHVLDDAWQQVARNRETFDSDAGRLELAKSIIECATKGERDRHKLIDYAVLRFTNRG